MDRTVSDRDHEIRASALPVTGAEEEAWTASVLLRDPDDRLFPTVEDAEAYGMHVVMDWVDRQQDRP